MKKRTIRELAGEVWAELDHELFQDAFEVQDTEKGLSLLNQTIDVMMGVLARYENYQIVNDKDLPVKRL